MNLLNLSAAVIWVEFLTVVLVKYLFTGSAVQEWYNKYQTLAVMNDYLSVMIGILLGKFLLPSVPLVYAAIIVQVIHDVLFYYLILVPMPTGHNQIIDILKKYANQSGGGIVLYDSFMIGSSVLLYDHLSNTPKEAVVLTLLVGLYALTYIIYTRA